MSSLRRLALPAGLLAVAQLVHGLTPAPETEAEGIVGFVGGLALLVGSIVVVVAAVRELRWARPLAVVVGTGVAGGFLLYHALPIKSPLTNPYFGTDGIGVVQWAPVILCIAIGAWLTAVALAPQDTARSAAA